MGGTTSRQTSKRVRPAPAEAGALAKKGRASPDGFVSVLTSNDVYSAVLSFAGFESVLAVETLSHAARRASRAAELVFDVTHVLEADMYMGKAIYIANREDLLRARRAGLLPDKKLVSSSHYRGMFVPFKPSETRTSSDMIYSEEGGVGLLSPCGRLSVIPGDGTAALDAPRAAAALAANKRGLLALLAHGEITINADPDPDDARANKLARRYFAEIQRKNGFIEPAKTRAGADDAAALVESMGGACLPRLLREAAERAPRKDHDGNALGPDRYRVMLDRSAASASSVDAAVLRRVVDAVAWANVRRKCCFMCHRVNAADFEAACRDAGVLRWREIWTEALDGLLLPFVPEYFSADDEDAREPGDVRPGDVAFLRVHQSAMLPALSGSIAARCRGDPAACFGPDLEDYVFPRRCTLALSIGVLKDLEARRDGEADGSAGKRRLEVALEAVLERHVPFKDGDDVEVYDSQDQTAAGSWKPGKLLMDSDGMSGSFCRVQFEDDRELTSWRDVRKAGEPSAATALLVAAVEHSRNDVVRLLLDLSPDFAAEAVLCPGGTRHQFHLRMTAYDHAILAGNSVALRLLYAKMPFARLGLNRQDGSFCSMRDLDHLSCKLAPKIRAELARVVVDGFYEDYALDLDKPAVVAAVDGDADRVWHEIGNLIAAQKRAELFHGIKKFAKKRWRGKRGDAAADEEDGASDDDYMSEEEDAIEAARHAASATIKSAIIAAARYGQLEVIETLFRFQTPNLVTMRLAAKNATAEDRPECVAFFLRQMITSRGREYAQSRFREVARLAARLGRPAILDVLLESGMSLHVDSDPHNTSILEYAAQYGQPEAIVSLLKDPAVRASLRDRRSDAIIVAAMNGHGSSLSLLLDVDGVDVDRVRAFPTAANHTSPLLRAVAENRLKTVEILLRRGANPGYCAPGFRTPLGVAAMQGYYEVGQCLLDFGAPVRRSDAVDSSALSLACRNFFCTKAGYDYAGADMVKLLLTERPDECPLNVPEAPLCDAVAHHGDAEMVRAFLDAGADVNNAVQDSGVTALHLAVYICVCTTPNYETNNRAEAVIRLLVSSGADLELRTRCQPTPRALYAHLYRLYGGEIPVGATPRDIAAVCGTPERQDAVAALLAAAVAERALKPA